MPVASSTTIAIGKRWEKRALDHLAAHGLIRLVKNFRCRFGEIDLVMLDRNCVVFIEVRYRRASRFASAASTVDAYKQRKLVRAAAAFLARHPQYCDHATRFDVVAFDEGRNDECKLQWLRDAFRPED